MRRVSRFLLCALLVVTAAGCATRELRQCGSGPKSAVGTRHCYVADSKTAIKIAVAVWEPIYGTKNVASMRPYRATLQDGVWMVRGSLPRFMCGGVPEADISQKDGKILRVSHGK